MGDRPASTPYGSTEVKWGITGAHGFITEATVSAGTWGTIAVTSSASTVKLNGKSGDDCRKSSLDTSVSGASALGYQYIDKMRPVIYRVSVDGL